MQQPPNDGGFPRPLVPDDAFYRAIPPRYHREDGSISSAAFSRASANKKMSVDWSELSAPQDTYDRWPQWGEGRAVAEISAQLCWDCEQAIEFAPTESNPAHSEVGNRPGSAIGGTKVRVLLSVGARLVPVNILPPQP